MEAEGQLISWGTFKEKFLHKYFPTDLKRKKEMEILKLEQGNMLVGDYAAKFEKMAWFCRYAKLEMDKRSKCVKFESGLNPKLKSMFGHQEITDFHTFVNKCRVYKDDLAVDEAATSKVIPPKYFGPHRNFSHGKGKGKAFQEERKPYSPPTGSRGYTSHGPMTHVTTGGSQLNSPFVCGKCGRTHVGDFCPGTALTCFRCKEVGHVRRYCPKLQQSVNTVRAERPRSIGRVFTISGAEASGVDGLIKGNCMVAGIPLLVLFDSGVTHSFVSIECVDILKLKIESLSFDLVVSTPTNMLVVVSTVVSRCPVVIVANKNMSTLQELDVMKEVIKPLRCLV
ncbi:hypothetical protein Lal_00036840 [Lupinus albus]|nr:hypothetical protein Lal_00036840 [Lupinus albus]